MARLSGLTARGGLAARCTNKGRAPCISPRGCATTEGTGRAFVGAGHARESAGSG